VFSLFYYYNHTRLQIGGCFGKHDRPKLTHNKFIGVGEPNTKDHWGHPVLKPMPVALVMFAAGLNEVWILGRDTTITNGTSWISVE
jgi:hypothetical protein